MDRIIVLYAVHALAERTRTQLVNLGVATDRVDVISNRSRGRVVHLPDQTPLEDLLAYFHILLPEERDWPQVEEVAESIERGKAALVVHPRGQVEIDMIRPTIDSFGPESAIWRVAPDRAQGGLLGEHAAGFKQGRR
ncbi:MAG: hypothetical protein ABI616_13600 [Pseudomonadota bacterium]